MPPLTLHQLAERWRDTPGAELAHFQTYVREFCEAIGVDPPGPAGTGYQFNLTIKAVARDGTEEVRYIDCYKQGHFAIEGKDSEPGLSNEVLLRKAFGQVRQYAAFTKGELPPYLMVMDVGRTLLIWDRWNGDYGGFSAGRRMDLTRLADSPEDVALLFDIWERPAERDPRARAQAVTRDVAAQLANLAAALEGEGRDAEQVARFIMRCVFTMFAEDIGLLPEMPFQRVLESATQDPSSFVKNAGDLWRAMDAGEQFLLRKLLRFNGHFFRDAEAVPLPKQAILILRLASEADWSHVEPAIFGTLLTRALDPVERHRLGAEFTPRAFVERVVRPTVEEPVRERWTATQAEVLQLTEAGKKKDAEQRLRDFHGWLKGLQFLDPACGSGNFLYVTMHIVKRIELEVIRALEEVTGKHEMRMDEVGPWQFHGIEVKAWAREIAELVLWIGFHQFWKAHHHIQPPEPILRDTGTLECRDAVLAWDRVRHDPSRDRPDPTPRIRHPVTGELVPDPKATLKYMEYVNPRPAEWPKADFIVGNPPYLGKSRQREALGEGYVDAIRSAYADVPDAADYVIYWWHRAAMSVSTGSTLRAGLITTNSIAQRMHQPVIEAAADAGACVVWAIPDHPWVDESGSAAVRVAMSVVARNPLSATRVDVDSDGTIVRSVTQRRLNPDFTVGADVTAVGDAELLSNEGLSSPGFQLDGSGFVLDDEDAAAFTASDARHRLVIRPYVNGRDLAAQGRGHHVIDFGLMDEEEAKKFPILYDVVRDRVRPSRQTSSSATERDFWWRFARPRPLLREALVGLERYVATPRTSRHRYFMFLDTRIAPDSKVMAVATDDAFVIGVLSWLGHRHWAVAAGGRLGVGNDPSYDKARCFDPFPFPDPPAALRAKIADVAERLDAHRKAAIERDEVVTMTGMYNVVEKLKSGAALTPNERKIHEIAACGVLKDLHDELDRLVAEAYGWEWPLPKEIILERLVALHDERVREEKAGKVRWLRPDYQVPRFGKDLPAAPGLDLPEAPPAAPAPKAKLPWPATAVEQITAIQTALAAEDLTVDEVAARFKGARTELVRRHVETLALMGEVREGPGGRYRVAALAVG